MIIKELEKIINKAFSVKEKLNENADKEIIEAINQTISFTDNGKLRVAEKKTRKLDS